MATQKHQGDIVEVTKRGHLMYRELGTVAKVESSKVTYPVVVQFAKGRYRFKHEELKKVG